MAWTKERPEKPGFYWGIEISMSGYSRQLFLAEFYDDGKDGVDMTDIWQDGSENNSIEGEEFWWDEPITMPPPPE